MTHTLNKTVALFASFALVAIAIPAFAATPNWELQEGTALIFTCNGTDYPHTLETVSQMEDGTLEGTGSYDTTPAYTWDMEGTVDGDTVSMVLTYTGLSAGTVYNLEGVVAPDGSISGTSDGGCQTFSMPAGSAVEIEDAFVRDAAITAPAAGESVSGVVSLEAWLQDEDGDDNVQWAVRMGTCAAGTETVAGNVDGFSDSFTWDGENFTASVDTATWAEGEYCFIFNPTESAGDTSIRETSNFFVTVVEEPEEPETNVPTSKNECKKGGWMDLTDKEGNAFKNQGQCVSYVATGQSAS